MLAQDLLTALGDMTKDQLINEVIKREHMIYEMQEKQLHLNNDEQYNALLNATRERDQHAADKNKEVAAHEETKRLHETLVGELVKEHKRERDQCVLHAEEKLLELKTHFDEKAAALHNGYEIGKAAALRQQWTEHIVPIKRAEHARQLEELKRCQDAELGAI
jgi:hypothetical protein